MITLVHSRSKSLAALLAAVAAGMTGVAHAEDMSSPSVPSEQPATADPTKFLHPGEVVVLRLGYGLIGNAGETRFETIAEDSAEGPRFRVKVSTTSRGLVETFYPLRNNSESLIDGKTGRPLIIKVNGKEGKRISSATTVFDYEKGIIEHTDHERPNRSGTIELPEKPIYDLMVTMMQARTWGMKAGDEREVLTSFGHDLYRLNVVALEETTVKTPAGRFKAVVLEPRQLGELKGMFKKGATMKFYISTEEEPQIVRLDVRTKVGTIVAELLEQTVVPTAKDANTASAGAGSTTPGS